MLKNKKSMELSIKALVRLIIAVAVLFLVVFPACNRLRGYISGISADTGSFEGFVEELNDMQDGMENFLLMVNKGTAVVGFSKDTSLFECSKCYPSSQSSGGSTTFYFTTIKIDKPGLEECSGKACACLCKGGFELVKGAEEDDFFTIWGSPAYNLKRIGQCKEYICKTLNSDIAGEITLNVDNSKWRNGFLFVTGLSDIGFEKYSDEEVLVYAEKKGNLIGVCSSETYTYNKNKCVA